MSSYHQKSESFKYNLPLILFFARFCSISQGSNFTTDKKFHRDFKGLQLLFMSYASL